MHSKRTPAASCDSSTGMDGEQRGEPAEARGLAGHARPIRGARERNAMNDPGSSVFVALMLLVMGVAVTVFARSIGEYQRTLYDVYQSVPIRSIRELGARMSAWYADGELNARRARVFGVLLMLGSLIPIASAVTASGSSRTHLTRRLTTPGEPPKSRAPPSGTRWDIRYVRPVRAPCNRSRSWSFGRIKDSPTVAARRCAARPTASGLQRSGVGS